ncbi:MAG: gamma-glutamylcyclotransferase [Gemmatimonadota bacterium]|nr:MAG: gamma-glutamylcyclotransferase [Gemmatimonadota bacterium]
MSRPGLLYFAYGCNMDPEFLARVVGLTLERGWAARLDGWRLAFNKGGEGDEGDSVVANLVPDARCCAYGVVYRLPTDALAVLDAFERVPEHYRRDALWVEPCGRYARQAALAYLAQPSWITEEGTPDPEYLEVLLRGSARHGHPAAYVNWIRSLARGQAREPYRAGAG